MIDFGKLYCDLHPNQLITNFCLKQTCLIGLCATCICTHTQQHVHNKSSPEYQNIRVTYSSMHQLIRNNISSLDYQKNRIDKLTEFIHTKRKTIKQNIDQIKHQTINALNQFFQQKQKNLLREMQTEEKKAGLHSQIRLESLMNSLNRQTATLITSAQEINSQNFLQSYKRIKSQILPNSSQLQKEISKQLDKNQDFETIINSSNDHIQKILKILDQSIYLSFKINSRPGNQASQSSIIYNTDVKNTFEPIQRITNEPTSRFIQQKANQFYEQKNLFNSNKMGMKSSLITDDFLATTNLTFNHQNQLIKKQTAKFDQLQQKRRQSITKSEDQRQHQRNLSNRSLINEIKKSTPIQSVYDVGIFKQRDSNIMEEGNSTSKNPSIISKNCQSQIIINHNKPTHSAFTRATYVEQTQPKQGYENMNQNSSINFERANQKAIKNNMRSQVFSGPVRSQLTKSQPRLIPNHIINPQPSYLASPVYFDQLNYNNKLTSQNFAMNLNNLSQCKKVKKSGLSLMKANQTGF